MLKPTYLLLCLAIGLSGALIIGSNGCSAPPPSTNTSSADPGDEPTSEATSALTFFNTCGNCPTGETVRLFCDPNCGSPCFGSNASQCLIPPTCGTIGVCGSTCPSGFAAKGFFCDTNNCGTPCFSSNAVTCTNISQQCCPCAPFPTGATNDRGAAGGQHFVELFASFSTSNPSMGTASAAACTCGISFNIGQIFCNGAATPVSVTFSSTTQINIAIPTSHVSRSCVAFSSSNNTQFIQFNFTTPPDP